MAQTSAQERRDEDATAAIIGRVVTAAREAGAGDVETAQFIGLLLRNGIHEDLARYAPAHLALAALDAFGHLREREPGHHKVRLSDPDITVRSDYGWQSAVTVIDIVNDNMPFLVDSVMGELQDRGVEVHLVLHPIVAVPRDAEGRISGPVADAGGGAAGEGTVESVMHVHIDRVEDAGEAAALKTALEAVLTDCRRAVSDWRAMLARLETAIAAYRDTPPPLPAEEVEEAAHFLHWLADDNFTLLGMREYVYDGVIPDGGTPARVADSGLGILRDPDVKVLRRGRELVTFTPEVREFLMQPVPLIVTKANVRSRVHRRAHMDYVGIKLFDGDGALSGELRVVGLFTSSAYNRSTRNIPLLRRKVQAVLRRHGHDPAGHSGKALVNVLEQYPRDELFQIDTETLAAFAASIVQLGEHPRIRVLARPDKFDRFVSILVFVPRERYSSDVRERIGDYLADTYDGRVSAFYPAFPEGALVRVHFIIGRYGGETPRPEQAALEEAVAGIVRSWEDDLHARLVRGAEPERLAPMMQRYAHAFSPAYQDAFSAEEAVRDLGVIETLDETRRVALEFSPGAEATAGVRLRLYSRGEHITLSRRVPVLENMGFRVINERTYAVSPEGGESVWLHDMSLESATGEAVAEERFGGQLEACFMAVWTGAAENDGYNALVLRAGLDWRQVAVLRAYSRYLGQVRAPFSQDYMWTTLTLHAGIAADLVALFEASFDPDTDDGAQARAARVKAIRDRIEEALEKVDSLDQDRIVRSFSGLIAATLRTNVYMARDGEGGGDGEAPQAAAYKLDPRALDGIPEPRPFAEIFVYSPRVEGVHLRFGKVARGGIRWSDRRQDFRTEVLGLVKAQQVKNAVIVPVGAKGGFLPKQMPADAGREEVQAEGIACYRIFISSLLDVTDNLDGAEIVPPPRVVRHDEDDPYLVVAADKGTASFSDIANEISVSRGFWLGDAFASGGSEGYDHKAMGITARGGWEAVKRHFREMDTDIQSNPFTVIGVGDMSGDVFGNGMLLSRQIRLVAAFDHRDIFIDPDPDPEASFKERERLFALPRSSWQDYDKSLIAKGGGVFSRKEKAIALSAEMKAITGLEGASAAPYQIIHALLAAKCDLLWFGGIGTYVRASDETDEQVGDRANDAVRVSARQLGAKVIGEGANLGMTQRARIQFALAGGRVNTDAIDNSAGVNTSDMEVNIKIALGRAMREGDLTREKRNALLHEMTEDVAALVLRNNYLQTLTLSLSAWRGMADFDFQVRLMRRLENEGKLNRHVEALADDAALLERERQSKPLTRPELAVLMAYAKIDLFDRLVASAVPDDAYLARELEAYFPAPMRERFAREIAEHRLRREIIATMLANIMIDRGGPTLVSRMVDETGADTDRIAAAFAAARDSFAVEDLFTSIDALDNRIAGSLQLELYAQVQRLLTGAVSWFLRNGDFSAGIAGVVETYAEGIETVRRALDEVAGDAARAEAAERAAQLEDAGVPAEIAARMAGIGLLSTAPDIVLVSQQTNRGILEVARAYFSVSAYFGTDRIVGLARTLDAIDYFDKLALNSALQDLAAAQRRLSADVVETGADDDDGLKRWARDNGRDLERTRTALKEIAGDGDLTLAKLAVGANLLRELVRR